MQSSQIKICWQCTYAVYRQYTSNTFTFLYWFYQEVVAIDE